MIRIHVLLLASLLSIWGLTSCENSDTDKVNSYNLEVNLSQNEITAINGIISIKVSIKEFDQLAYLVINKINDTNNISEKYIKSNLSPEYIFEYIIKKDDSSTLSNVFTGDLQPIEYGFIVIVEFTGLIIIDTVAAGSPYPYIVVRSFENFADGIVRQVGVVLVILLEGVAVVFVES